MTDPYQDKESDLALLEGLKAGKRECYEALFNRHLQPIYWFIYYMVHQKEVAEDLTQDVFIKLYHNAHLYRHTGSFSAWLHQMAKNVTLDYLRREQRVQKWTESIESALEIEDEVKDR